MDRLTHCSQLHRPALTSRRFSHGWLWLAVGLAIWFGAGLPFGAVHAEAPTITLSGPAGLIHADDLIPVDVLASSGGLSINAAQVTVTYPPDQLRVEFIRREQSIFNLWPEVPAWDNQRGRLTLNGGRPGGLVTVQSRVATIYFRAARPGSVSLSIDPIESVLYLNDGAGTKVTVAAASIAIQLSDTLVPGIPLNVLTVPKPNTWSRQSDVTIGWDLETDMKYSYQFSADCQVLPDDQPETAVGQVNYSDLADGIYCFGIKSRHLSGPWSTVSQYRFLIDGTPPRPFGLHHPDPRTVGGANLLTWATSDDVSDIATTTLDVPGQTDRAVTSPLPIAHAWSGRLVTIIVTDAAGNKQSASWQVAGSKPLSMMIIWWAGAAGVLIIGGLVVVWRRRSRRR